MIYTGKKLLFFFQIKIRLKFSIRVLLNCLKFKLYLTTLENAIFGFVSNFKFVHEIKQIQFEHAIKQYN